MATVIVIVVVRVLNKIFLYAYLYKTRYPNFKEEMNYLPHKCLCLNIYMEQDIHKLASY